MLKIAHRGNIHGRSDKENDPGYVMNALELGYDAEVDAWLIDGQLWAGHDSVKYLLEDWFMKNQLTINGVWFHCKNLEALEYFIDSPIKYKYFWHQNDNYALTSNGLIWTYPGKPVSQNCIIVDFNNNGVYETEPYGICSDIWK